jgi:signal transduction histidine kinase
LNVLANAGDAMPQGGTLTIRTSQARLEKGKPAVSIEFIDTGVGIPAEYLGRAMDNFFTTKEEGKGTGLGLPICRRIVQEHHGTIQIVSKVASGTAVRIVLPICNDSTSVPFRGAVPSK